MAFIKCKMCGGDLHITEGSTVCECEYCGSKQTIPTADNEKKMTLFTRANRLLRNCEFDKASGVFETIVAEFPEEAEAYWGLVLCRYGIEYVDDPATGKKIPTCHRSSFDSVLDDSNYEQACEIGMRQGLLRNSAKISSKFPVKRSPMIFSSATKRLMRVESAHLTALLRRTSIRNCRMKVTACFSPASAWRASSARSTSPISSRP